MDFMNIIGMAPIHIIEDKKSFPEEGFIKVYEGDDPEFKFGFYKLKNDALDRVYAKVYYSFTVDGEIYNEYGDSHLETIYATWNLDFNAEGDNIVLDEIFKGDIDDVCDFLIDLSKILLSKFLILSCDNKPIGYIEYGKCYEYKARRIR